MIRFIYFIAIIGDILGVGISNIWPIAAAGKIIDVGIMQKIPNRISDNIPESNKYIDSNYNDATCTCNKCYGSGNTFSDECNM